MTAILHPRQETRSTPRWPFLAVTAALFVLLMSANLPAGLYTLYRQRFGFASVTLTAVFATYAVVLIPSLILFGQLSDRIGRRRVLLSGLAVSVLALVVFALARGTGWLFVARALQGVAVSATSGTATAALVEAEPGGNHARAAIAALVGQAGGSATGPFLAGILAQYAPWPRQLCYLAGIAGSLAVLLLAALLAGAGLGVAFFGAQTRINQVVPADRRGEVTAAFITCVYAGVAAASIAVGLLSERVTLAVAVGIVSVIVGTAAVATAVVHTIAGGQ